MTAPLRREARGRSTGAPALGYPRAARTIFRARGGCPLVRDNAPVPGARDAGHRKFRGVTALALPSKRQEAWTLAWIAAKRNSPEEPGCFLEAPGHSGRQFFLKT